MVRTLIIALALALPGVAAADFSGGIEFLAGFGVGAESEVDGKSVDGSDAWSAIAFGIIPGIDQMLAPSVGIGAEMGFWWFSPDGDNAKGDSQLVLSPHLRARMSFPIVEKVTFDGMLGVGPTIWTSRDVEVPGGGNQSTDSRFGWSLRFNFGGSYAINDQVSAFANLGYFTTTTYGDDITATLNTIPLGVGVRGTF
ncbi:MAG: outer membrane beta-barrel protein [Myxococcales bacterium]|nr:outer membrane beta-barrel protein [Myxococcales bacterium]